MASELGVGAIVGGYRIEGVAGRGGMGVVYRATQLALERPVALKLIAPEATEDRGFRARFQRESKVLAQLDHPHVVTVHEAGEHDGMLYIAMRFVHGRDLRQLIAEEGRLDPPRAANLVAQVGEALDVAHSRGLVHRDVKPANVLVERRGDREHAYITDFGLTKLIEATTGGMTATGEWLGTVDFVAPEQIEGKRVDGRADVYALGCVLYMALTGTPPFPRDSQAARLWAHLGSPAPQLTEALPDAPRALEEVILRSLEKEPDARFPTAGELGRAALVAAGEGSQSGPGGPDLTGTTSPAAGGATRQAAPAPPTAAGDTVPAARRRRALPLIVGGVLLAVVLAAGAIALLGGGGSDPPSALDAPGLESLAVEVGSAPRGVAVGEGAAWVANEGDGSVTPVSAGGKPGRAIATDGNPVSIAAGEGGVWVMSLPDRVVRRIDPGTRRAGPPIDLPDGGNGELVVGEGHVWASDADKGTINRISPAGRPLDRLEVTSGTTGAFAVGAGKLWVVGYNESGDSAVITPIDASTGDQGRPIELDTPCGGGVGFGGDAVWVGDCENDRVLRLDPERRRVVARARAPAGVSDLRGSVAFGGGAVWVLEVDEGALTRIDPDTSRAVGKPTAVPADGSSYLAVGLDAAWVSSSDDAIVRLDFK